MWIKFLHNFTFKKNGPFLWMGLNCLTATEPLRGESLLFTTRSPGDPGTHLINLRRMKGWVDLGTIQWFWAQSPWIRNLVGYFQAIIFKKLKYFIFHLDFLHLKFTKIWQTFTHTKESQKTRCFLYTVILIFTSNHICTLQNLKCFLK